MKYHNIKVKVDGMTFDSKGEYNRWLELKMLEKSGKISNLTRQVTYKLTAHGVQVCKYIADFEYDYDGMKITEDFKGLVTPTFKLKAKIFAAQEGRPIIVSKKQR